VPVVFKSWNLKLLEPLGPSKVCTLIALPFHGIEEVKLHTSLVLEEITGK
jgi:hypothetical protein